jgi:flagellar hook protein FlgE
MSLYGALFSGVSGLSAQSSAMGAISDNISNVNTIGYKGTDVNFQTLVTHQVSSTEYSPGGVESNPRSGIDVQGLLQSTTSSTDMALSGQGFFIVNSVPVGGGTAGGQFAYTRAGSFKPDQNGYLQNSAGYYLEGWPLTPADPTDAAAAPGAETINGTLYTKAYTTSTGAIHYINQNIVSGTEMQPLNVNTIGGSAEATMNISLGANLPSGDPIYDPTQPSLGGQHDSNVLTYDSLGNSSNSQFTWTKTAANQWQLAVTPPPGAASVTLANTSYTGVNNGTVTKTYAAAGQVEFSSLPPTGSSLTINGVKIQFFTGSYNGAADPTSDASAPPVLGVTLTNIPDTTTLVSQIQARLAGVASDPITYPNMSKDFLGGVADGADRFTADTNVLRINQEPGAAAVNVDCSSATLGASVVETGTGIGSQVANPGVFTVGAIDPSYSTTAAQSTSFTVAAVPTGGVLKVGGVSMNWTNIVTGTAAALGGAYTALPNQPATTAAQVAQNAAAFLNELNGAGGALQNYTAVASNGTVTMTASASASPVGVELDNGGTATDMSWASSTQSASTTALLGASGAYSSGTTAITFNGDGTPASITPNSMNVYWANGSQNQAGSKTTTNSSSIALKFGDVNQSDGMTQLGGSYQLTYLKQDGAKFGNYTGVSIGSDGVVTALFDNGVRTPVFQIPIATFANADGMESLSGDVFEDTTTSGAYTVRSPGEAGSGTVTASSLESSTVDLGTEFTNMIVVQRAYSASAKIITTADQMLDDLINIKR